MLRSLTTAFAVFTALIGTAFAHEIKVGDLVIDHPYARASAPNAFAGASYFTIRNTGSEADTLIAASSDVADKIELHTHIHDGDVVRMREVEGGIEIPAGGEVTLQPGGLHVMLIGLWGPLVEGQTFPLALEFAKAGTVSLDVMIEGAAANHGDHSGHGHHH